MNFHWQREPIPSAKALDKWEENLYNSKEHL